MYLYGSQTRILKYGCPPPPGAVSFAGAVLIAATLLMVILSEFAHHCYNDGGLLYLSMVCGETTWNLMLFSHFRRRTYSDGSTKQQDVRHPIDRRDSLPLPDFVCRLVITSLLQAYEPSG